MTAIPTDVVERCLIGAAASLVLSPVDEAGESFELTGPATVEVSDGAGSQVYTGAATISTDAKSMSAEVPAASLVELDTYTVEWSAEVADESWTWSSTLEICGGHLFSIAALRAQPDLSGYSAARIREYRRLAEARMETECAVAFVPRGAREQHRGDGRAELILGHVALRDIYSLTVDGVALSATELAALIKSENGVVALASGVWEKGAVIDVHDTHGYDRPQADVAGAVLTLATDVIVPGKLPGRATAQTTELGTFRLSVAGRDGATGIPDVDVIIRREDRHGPAVG